MALRSDPDDHDRANRDRAIVNAYRSGATAKEIGDEIGLSKARVGQIIADHERATGEVLPRKLACHGYRTEFKRAQLAASLLPHDELRELVDFITNDLLTSEPIP